MDFVDVSCIKRFYSAMPFDKRGNIKPVSVFLSAKVNAESIYLSAKIPFRLTDLPPKIDTYSSFYAFLSNLSQSFKTTPLGDKCSAPSHLRCSHSHTHLAHLG